MEKISVVINTLNEQKNIADCILSVKGLADEVIVCDMQSDDLTAQIARDLGAQVIYHDRVGFVEPARFYAISEAHYEWILVIDADERMTEHLARKLRELSADQNVDIVSFWSLFWYFGGWVRHGNFFCNTWTRFFRKRIYLETYNKDEEYVHGNFLALNSHRGNLRLDPEYYILHLAYPTIEKYVNKTIGLYARLEGQQYHARGIRFSLIKMIGVPIRKFFGRFIIRQGYRDGVRGLILATLYAVYWFAIWANLWLVEELEEKKKHTGKSTDIPGKFSKSQIEGRYG